MDQLESYSVWSAVVTEVQVDVLTGEMTIVRVDLSQDTGTSISPEVDVGQVEGGLIMGLGTWLLFIFFYLCLGFPSECPLRPLKANVAQIFLQTNSC